MHNVKRGPAPSGLDRIRQNYTPRWVRYYNDGLGNKPSDSKWQDFHKDVSDIFFGICGYCETECKGEVDHFRPKSKFPELVYMWDNWVLACHVCNNIKSGKWPTGGYVDPCTKSRSARPESYFTFDTLTGEIIPKSNLSPGRKGKSDTMIKDLKLNAYHQLKQRITWLMIISTVLTNNEDNQEFIRRTASREGRFSSITREWLDQQGYSYDN